MPLGGKTPVTLPFIEKYTILILNVLNYNNLYSLSSPVFVVHSNVCEPLPASVNLEIPCNVNLVKLVREGRRLK